MRLQVPGIAAWVCGVCMLSAYASEALAQPTTSSKPLLLITWFGPGAIALPRGTGWKPEMLTVYDKGRRPVAQFLDESRHVDASFILFENLSGKPNESGCRQDVINPILAQDGKHASNRLDGEAKTSDGQTLATTSFLLNMELATVHHQRNLFGFAGSATTCAEIHLSSVVDSAEGDEAMKSVLAEFQPDLSYRPSAADYFRLGSVLFRENAPELAAPYYKASLDAMPQDPSYRTARRVTTDQLVMSLGMSGELKNSRAVAETAISADPDYPMNYYNLACADAEEGDAAHAKIHLQQAFDRRTNVLEGEALPDPSKDDSILKLKHDKAFWAFVLSLPKS